MDRTVNASDVGRAAELLAPIVRRTPLEECGRLTSLVGGRVLLKREDIQLCRSYKVRGAYNLIASLTPEQRQRGAVCASAGNFAQGVSFACSALQLRARIFLPTNTPRQKRERIEAIGGPWVELILTGATYDDAAAAAAEESRRTGAEFAHPFDDARTIAGQGTLAAELASQAGDDLGSVVVPIGGGGLISGMALWLREHRPAVRIIGVEPAGAASMRAALDAGTPVDLAELDTFVDGAAVGRVGTTTFPIVRDLVDDVVAVDEGAVCSEMLELYQTEGVIAEPAGALASAALRTAGSLGPRATVCVVSGGNNDVSRYADIVERSLLYEGLRHYFLVTFSQEPGSLRRFLDDVLIEGEDIIAFEYVKKNNRETGPALVGIELQRAADVAGLLQRMDASPLHVELVSPGSPLFSFLM